MDRANDPAALAADEPLRRTLRIVITYQSCLLSVMVRLFQPRYRPRQGANGYRRQLYDWLLNLKKEYKYMWKQKLSWITALYVILRYFEFVRAMINIYLADAPIPNGDCPPWARFQVYGAMTVQAVVYLLFIIRASAVYGNSTIVKIFLGAMASTILVLQGIASTEFGTIPWAAGHGGCFAGKTPQSNNLTVIFWLGPFIFDAVTTVMIFVRIVMIRRQGGVNSSMLNLLIRDGMLYFVIISAINLINVGFYLGASKDIHSINSAAAYDVTSLACCRLMLSLRHHAYKQDPSLTATRRNITQFKSGVVKVRNPAEVRFEAEEKGISPYGEPGFQAHIALDTFRDIHRKNEDNESLNSDSVGQAAPVQRVFVVTETKTAVDERAPGEVEVKR